MDDRGFLCVFAKPPRPGEVKTRLARDVGAESAAVLARARSAPRRSRWPSGPTRLTCLTRPLEGVRRALTAADAVIGPCDDGGFCLLGLTRCPPGLLADLPWSAGDTFARTAARLREHGLTVETLPPWFDVDRVEDLSCVQALLSRGEIEAPETERALRAMTIPDRGCGCR